MHPSSDQMAQHLSPTFHCFEGLEVFFLWLLFLADFLLGVPFGFSEASEMSPFFRACLNEATALSYAFINAVSSQTSESSLSPVPRRNSTESSGSGKPPPLPPPPPPPIAMASPAAVGALPRGDLRAPAVLRRSLLPPDEREEAHLDVPGV